MKLIISDDQAYLRFAPLTLTRPLSELRMGLLTNTERWALLTKIVDFCIDTNNPYLSDVYPAIITENADITVNARVIPNQLLVEAIMALNEGEELVTNGDWIARKGAANKTLEYTDGALVILNNRWDLYLKNDIVLKADFELVTSGRKSQPIPQSNTILGDTSLIFLEEGATVEASILNTKSGPIYLAKDAEIMEGCMIRGPFGLGEHAGVKMGTKIYGATSVGPHCKVGGEISNSIFLAYSNKGHDGFIGNAYIGAWCNLGADTNSSNLKNNYGSVKTYCYETEKMQQTDVTFMGVFMGDHSKCSINTMFNTATVVGVSANIFSAGFPPKVIPSFSWGPNLEKFDFHKALEVAESMMKRRGLTLSKQEHDILHKIFESDK